MLSKLTRGVAFLDRWIERLERFVLAVSIMAMAAMNIANAVGRTVFANSLTSTEEINQIFLILITFMGLGYAARLGRHIRMTALYDQLHGKPRKTLQIVSTLGTALLLFLLAYYATDFVASKMRFGGSTPALGIPWYAVYFVVPAGLLLGGVQFTLAALRNMVTPGVHTSFRHEESYDESQPPASL